LTHSTAEEIRYMGSCVIFLCANVSDSRDFNLVPWYEIAKKHWKWSEIFVLIIPEYTLLLLFDFTRILSIKVALL